MSTLKISLFFILFTSHVFAQSVEQKIDSFLKTSHEKHPNITMNVGFIQHDKVHHYSYGMLSRDTRIPSNENTLFEIASITKVFTSHLIAQAILEKKINSDDYIDDYLPKGYQLQNSLKETIRISDLASHQSGLPDIDFRALIKANPQQPTAHITRETLQQIVNNCSQLIDHGAYRYSTLGFVLLGEILETVYGKKYAQILEEKIIRPVKMTRTFTTNYGVDNKITGYNPQGGVQEFFTWNVVAPAGLVKSTSKDMISFLQAVLSSEGKIAKAARVTEQTFYDKGGRQIGLAVNIINTHEDTLYLKTGDNMGQSSILCYDKKNSWGLILFINQSNGPLREELFWQLHEIIHTSK